MMTEQTQLKAKKNQEASSKITGFTTVGLVSISSQTSQTPIFSGENAMSQIYVTAQTAGAGTSADSPLHTL
jgi:hypothetical protein